MPLMMRRCDGRWECGIVGRCDGRHLVRLVGGPRCELQLVTNTFVRCKLFQRRMFLATQLTICKESESINFIVVLVRAFTLRTLIRCGDH